MRKGPRVSLIVMCLILESCKSDFNINAPYQDVYVLNCILRTDTSIQYALISKNYFTENGIVPPANSIEPNIKNANIKIYYDDSMFNMRDTTALVADSGNVAMVDCYYVKNLILSPGKVISIEASVPGGDTLKSTIQVPQIVYSNFSLNFPQPQGPGYQKIPSYSWSWAGNNGGSAPILDLPQLEVYYKKYEDGTMTDNKILIPMAYYFTFNEDGSLVPVNDTLSFSTSCITTLQIVNQSMQEISGEDPNKDNYVITKVKLSVISLDPNLTKYYCANQTYSNNFTVKLRQADFSNINGGKGIFGLYYVFHLPLAVDSLYIESFGYRYDPSWGQ